MIDRSTKYGNPFKTHADGGDYTRKGAIEMFEQWWYSDDQAELRTEADENLVGEDLGCWCVGDPVSAPERPFDCHGEVILDYLLHGDDRTGE